MLASILISGAGQLGSRYLQGAVKCDLPLKIFVHDPNSKALEIAKLRLDEVSFKKLPHEVFFITSLEDLPTNIDIAIVATSADKRLYAISSIFLKTNIKYWILEKLLAQNVSDLNKLMTIINLTPAWVNTSRRLMPWHTSIKEQLNNTGPFKFEVNGGSWGLACNSIHLLDLFSWWSGEYLQDISTANLDKDWFESKRQNFWEVTGELKAKFSGGSVANIICDQSTKPVVIKLKNVDSWVINESEGFARKSDGTEINGTVNFQSDITASMIETILLYGSCNLPSLEESVELHRIFIHELFEHWRKMGNPLATFIPIT